MAGCLAGRVAAAVDPRHDLVPAEFGVAGLVMASVLVFVIALIQRRRLHSLASGGCGESRPGCRTFWTWSIC